MIIVSDVWYFERMWFYGLKEDPFACACWRGEHRICVWLWRCKDVFQFLPPYLLYTRGLIERSHWIHQINNDRMDFKFACFSSVVLMFNIATYCNTLLKGPPHSWKQLDIVVPCCETAPERCQNKKGQYSISGTFWSVLNLIGFPFAKWNNVGLRKLMPEIKTELETTFSAASTPYKVKHSGIS